MSDSTRTVDGADYDVIVVGAGPAGLTTATALARHGVRVLVVEKHPGLSIFPKAVGVRPRSMEIFRSWGLEPEVRRRSQYARVEMSVSPTLSGPREVLSMGLPDPDVLARTSPTTIAMCGQDQLEAVLLDHLESRGGEVRFRTQLTGLAQTHGVVTAQLLDRDGGARTEVTARYLVGADGGRSAVRSLIGVEFETLGSEGNHLAVLFRADLSSVMPDPPYVLSIVTAPGVDGLFATTAQQDRWIYDADWHPEAGDRLEDWTPERVTDRLRAASGIPDLRPEIIGLFPWDFGAGIAHGYRRGRIFLVGDAAHRTTPRGATGMNTGIADAHNLGWKLAWVINGWAAETLLDSYEAEREPVGRANAAASLQTMVSRPASDGLAHDFGVSYASGAVVGGTPLAGRRAPHAWVLRSLSPSDGEEISTLDLFDGRFTLLTGADGSDWRAAATELAELGVPLAVFSLGVELGDPTGELVARYGLADRGAVLVRPDAIVAWGSDEADVALLRDALQLATGHRVADLVG